MKKSAPPQSYRPGPGAGPVPGKVQEFEDLTHVLPPAGQDQGFSLRHVPDAQTPGSGSVHFHGPKGQWLARVHYQGLGTDSPDWVYHVGDHVTKQPGVHAPVVNHLSRALRHVFTRPGQFQGLLDEAEGRDPQFDRHLSDAAASLDKAEKPKKGGTWSGRPILDPGHAPVLEAAAAAREFGDRRSRSEAEEDAHRDYRREHHLDAAAHHLRGMKAASSDPEEAHKHSVMYGLHLQALGENPYKEPPAEVRSRMKDPEAKRLYRYKGHDADTFIPGQLKKSELNPGYILAKAWPKDEQENSSNAGAHAVMEDSMLERGAKKTVHDAPVAKLYNYDDLEYYDGAEAGPAFTDRVQSIHNTRIGNIQENHRQIDAMTDGNAADDNAARWDLTNEPLTSRVEAPASMPSYTAGFWSRIGRAAGLQKAWPRDDADNEDQRQGFPGGAAHQVLEDSLLEHGAEKKDISAEVPARVKAANRARQNSVGIPPFQSGVTSPLGLVADANRDQNERDPDFAEDFGPEGFAHNLNYIEPASIFGGTDHPNKNDHQDRLGHGRFWSRIFGLDHIPMSKAWPKSDQENVANAGAHAVMEDAMLDAGATRQEHTEGPTLVAAYPPRAPAREMRDFGSVTGNDRDRLSEAVYANHHSPQDQDHSGINDPIPAIEIEPGLEGFAVAAPDLASVAPYPHGYNGRREAHLTTNFWRRLNAAVGLKDLQPRLHAPDPVVKSESTIGKLLRKGQEGTANHRLPQATATRAHTPGPGNTSTRLTPVTNPHVDPDLPSVHAPIPPPKVTAAPVRTQDLDPHFTSRFAPAPTVPTEAVTRAARPTAAPPRRYAPGVSDLGEGMGGHPRQPSAPAIAPVSPRSFASIFKFPNPRLVKALPKTPEENQANRAGFIRESPPTEDRLMEQGLGTKTERGIQTTYNPTFGEPGFIDYWDHGNNPGLMGAYVANEAQTRAGSGPFTPREPASTNTVKWNGNTRDQRNDLNFWRRLGRGTGAGSKGLAERLRAPMAKAWPRSEAHNQDNRQGFPGGATHQVLEDSLMDQGAVKKVLRPKAALESPETMNEDVHGASGDALLENEAITGVQDRQELRVADANDDWGVTEHMAAVQNETDHGNWPENRGADRRQDNAFHQRREGEEGPGAWAPPEVLTQVENGFWSMLQHRVDTLASKPKVMNGKQPLPISRPGTDIKANMAAATKVRKSAPTTITELLVKAWPKAILPKDKGGTNPMKDPQAAATHAVLQDHVQEHGREVKPPSTTGRVAQEFRNEGHLAAYEEAESGLERAREDPPEDWVDNPRSYDPEPYGPEAMERAQDYEGQSEPLYLGLATGLGDRLDRPEPRIDGFGRGVENGGAGVRDGGDRYWSEQSHTRYPRLIQTGLDSYNQGVENGFQEINFWTSLRQELQKPSRVRKPKK